MGSAPEIPVKVEISESHKTAIILILWHELSRVDVETFQAGWARAAKIRADLEAKGHQNT